MTGNALFEHQVVKMPFVKGVEHHGVDFVQPGGLYQDALPGLIQLLLPLRAQIC